VLLLFAARASRMGVVIAAAGSRDNNRHVAVFLLASRADSDFNILPKSCQKLHEPLDGIGTGLAAHQARNMGLLDPEDFPGLRLCQAAPFDEAVRFGTSDGP
jgi:hypothetical protein